MKPNNLQSQPVNQSQNHLHNPEVTDTATKKRIMKERATRYARSLTEETTSGETIEGLEFLLTAERYIIGTEFIGEVIPLKELTPLPCTPPYILGIINVRGRILSVVNLKTFLDLPAKGLTNLNRVIILKQDNIEVGILVDEVLGKTTYYPDTLKKSLPTLTGAQKEYLVGVTPDRSIVFDIEKLLTSPAIIVDEEV